MGAWLLLTALPCAAQDPSQQATGCPTNPTRGQPPYVCVTTFMYSPMRLGLNISEPQITQSELTTGGFGLLFSASVDDSIYGQPLYLPQVVVSGIPTNLVYVATESNSVYAFNADTGASVWGPISLNGTNAGPVNEVNDLQGCQNITFPPQTTGNIGATGTGVIDISQNPAGAHTITAGTLYVAAVTKSPSTCTVGNTGCTVYQDLWALNVITGSLKDTTANHIPRGIVATSNGFSFDPTYANQRAALLSLGATTGANGHEGQVYVGFASHCDLAPWAGWLMSYQLSPTTGLLSQTAALIVSSSSGTFGSIWEGGNGPASDGTTIFIATGNGPNTVPTNPGPPTISSPDPLCTTPCDYSDSIVKLSGPTSPSPLTVLDYFTPYDRFARQAMGHDADLGSGGNLVVPNLLGASNPSALLVQAGKEGNLYLVNRQTGLMGGYSNITKTDYVVQAIRGNASVGTGLCLAYLDPSTKECGMWTSPAWWNVGNALNTSSPYLSYIYVAPEGNNTNGSFSKVIQYVLCPGPAVTGCAASSTPQLVLGNSTSDFNLGYPGLTPVVTAASPTSTPGILWALDNSAYNSSPKPLNAVLRAYDAATLAPLWNSSTNPLDNAADAVKFTVPTVANGRVYVGGTGGTKQLRVYGKKP